MTAEAQGSASGRRLLVIHNPVAGRRRRKRFWEVLELLERDGNELTLHMTEAQGDAIAFAREIAPGDTDLVVAAGGDGTINEVANGLVPGGLEKGGRPAPAPLAIVPLGTSNVLAAEIGLSPKPVAVARTIREGATARVSLGRFAGPGPLMDERPAFLLMAGVGVDAQAVAGVETALKRRFAQGAYVWAGLKAVLASRGQRYLLEVDGARHEAAWAVVAKAGRYGGPFLLAPRARLDEPHFEVCLFDRGGLGAMALYGSALVLGLLPRAPGFTSVLGERVRISALAAEGAEPLQCDGDDMARLPVEIEVLPDALDLVVPRAGRYGS